MHVRPRDRDGNDCLSQWSSVITSLLNKARVQVGALEYTYSINKVYYLNIFSHYITAHTSKLEFNRYPMIRP
jgi:hypothetical protein